MVEMYERNFSNCGIWQSQVRPQQPLTLGIGAEQGRAGRGAGQWVINENSSKDTRWGRSKPEFLAAVSLVGRQSWHRDGPGWCGGRDRRCKMSVKN